MVSHVAEQGFVVSTLWAAEAWEHYGVDGNTSTSFVLGLFAVIALSSPLPGGGDFGMPGLDSYFAQSRSGGALKMHATNFAASVDAPITSLVSSLPCRPRATEQRR